MEDAATEADLAGFEAAGLCGLWPQAKRVLEFIREEVLGDGWRSKIVKWAIGQIIKIGDRACPSS